MNVAVGPETRVTQTFRGMVRLRLLEKSAYKPFWTEKQWNKHKSRVNAWENGHCDQFHNLFQRHRDRQCLSEYLALHDCLAPIDLCKTRNRKTEWFEPGWKFTRPGVHSLIRRGTFFNVDKNWDQIVVKFIPDVIFKLEKGLFPLFIV